MAYPQPNADKYVLEGFEFFRLTTPLSSAGDIYESAQGAQAFALGPNSDISRVNIAYHDNQIPDQGRMAQIQISPQRTFTGLINAKNKSGLYTPSNRPGKILFWPDEYYNPLFQPQVNGQARVDWIEPVIDIIQYFQAPDPTLDPQRADKTYVFNQLPFPEDGDIPYFLMIPFYGRRSLDFSLSNPIPGIIPITTTLFGVNFSASASQNGPTNRQFVTTIDVGTVASAFNASLTYSASKNGGFDYLCIRMDRGAPGTGFATLLRVTTSDNDAGCCETTGGAD